MERLMRLHKKLVKETKTDFFRYLYQEINWDNRMIGIRGPRGVGKTTLLLQHIKKDLSLSDTLYVNADDLYFSEHRLIDLAERLVQQGIHYFFIDEIHKYKDWSKELKLIYDYFSELYVIFSGSSVLDLNKGSSDLSRRALMYHLYGLSFREYLALFHGLSYPTFTLDELIDGAVESIDVATPLRYFEDYLKRGYYPFAKELGFEEKLRQIINLTLENDIPVFAGLSASMGQKLKRLLTIIAKSVPFKPNMSKLAELIGTGRNQMPDYLFLIEQAGMIAQLRDDTGGIRGLGKVDKVYLDNPSLAYLLGEGEAKVGNIRETFFLSQLRVKNPIISSSLSDFEIGSRTFEIGGKSKGKKQIENAAEGYVVKDQIEFGSGNTLPLWWFGFNY